MAKIIKAIKTLIAQHQQKIRQENFLEAVMGACALLAVADGEVDFSELMARDYVLDNVQQLQLCDVNEAAEIFRHQTEALQRSYEEEKQRIIKLISGYAEEEELAPLLLQICLVIAQADRDFTPSEKEIINELRQVLHRGVDE